MPFPSTVAYDSLQKFCSRRIFYKSHCELQDLHCELLKSQCDLHDAQCHLDFVCRCN